MSNYVGRMKAILGLDKRGFDKGIADTQTKMQRAAQRMHQIGKNVARAGAGLSVVSAGMTLAIRQQLNAADQMSKDAQKLGVPIDQLSALRHAADMSGVSTGELDTALGRMARTMDEAAQGGKRSVALFERLGVKATGADGKLRPMSDVMGDVAQVLSEMPDGAEKSALAIELFGRSGAALIPMLNGGKAGLQGMIEEARELGLVIDGKTGKAAENFNDNLSRLAKTVKGIVIQAMAALAPIMEKISAAAVDASKVFRSLSPATQSLAAGIAVVTAAAGPLALGLGAVMMAVKPLFAGLALLASPLGLVVAGFAAVAVGAAYVVKNWDDLKKRFPVLQNAADFGKRIAAAWSDLPAIKWAMLVPAFRWSRFIPVLKWSMFVPKIAWAGLAGTLRWGALVGRLAWGALGVISPIGWAALAGMLAWSTLVKELKWDGWIPRIVWADWVPKLNWDGFLQPIKWDRYLRGQKQAAASAAASHMQSVGRDIGEGLQSGLMSTAPGTAAATRDYLKSIEDAARDETETQSPSRVWARLGKDLMDGLGLGIRQGGDNPVAGLMQVADRLTQQGAGMTDIFKTIGATSRGVFSQIGQSVGSMITGTMKWRDALQGVLKSLAQVFAQRAQTQAVAAFGGAGSIGGALVGGLISGLTGFDGGGYTGDGARVGGLDGKGAFLAKLHPQETVIDHTKGIGGGRRSGAQVAEVRVIGGDLTLTDDGKIAARIRVTAAQSGQQAVQTVKANLKGWQDTIQTRGTLT